jgi:hypothetical protein
LFVGHRPCKCSGTTYSHGFRPEIIEPLCKYENEHIYNPKRLEQKQENSEIIRNNNKDNDNNDNNDIIHNIHNIHNINNDNSIHKEEKSGNEKPFVSLFARHYATITYNATLISQLRQRVVIVTAVWRTNFEDIQNLVQFILL